MSYIANADPRLAGLRKALGGSFPLLGDANVALFPKGKPGKALADAAINDGLLVSRKVKEKVDGKNKTTEYGEITEKGRDYVVSADDPKGVLEALLVAVQKLGEPRAPAPIPDSVRREIEKASEGIQKKVQTAIDNLQKSVSAEFAKLEKKANDDFAKLEKKVVEHLATSEGVTKVAPPSGLFEAIDKALSRLKPHASDGSGSSASSSPHLEDEIVGFVESWAGDKAVGCQLDFLWNHLRERHPHLSIGAFQDALRKLHAASRIRLSGWPRMIDELPEPKLALFVSDKVMYYAQPAHSHH